MPSQSRSKPVAKGRGKPGKTLGKKGKNRMELEEGARERRTEHEIQTRDLRDQIDERKISEETLRESQERYRALIENSPDAIVVHQDGRFVYANQAAVRLYGAASFEELEGKSILELSHPDDREKIAARIKQAAEGTTVALQETRVIRLDGQQVFIEAAAGPIDYRGGAAVQAIVRDITTRKQMEKTLRESQQDLNHAQAVSHTGSWRLDVRRNELLWSDETYRIFGIPKGTPLTYEAFLAAVHPDDRNYVDQKWAAALRGEPYDIEHRIVVGTEIKWVRERAEMEFDAQGGLLGGFGIVHDTTERKRAEEALREAHERAIWLARFPEENPNPVMRVSADGRILYCNPASTKLPGWTCEVGKVPPNWLMPLVSRAMGKGDEAQHDVEIDGRFYFVWVSPFSGESYANVYGRDITERKQAEEALQRRTLELQQLTETLEQRVKERTAELAALSSELLVAQEKERRRISLDLHDNIWQGLEVIKLEIEALFSKPGCAGSEDFYGKAREIVAMIRETVAKIRSVQGALWPSVLDDIGILATIDWYCREFEKKHSGIVIEKRIDLAEDEVPAPAKIVIYRVMQEAMNNVAKHSHGSHVSISLKKGDHRLEFRVEDNGDGFDPEEAIVKRSPWGGMGLLSMKERSVLSGGFFDVESTKGKGTAIRVSWPLNDGCY